MNGASILVAIWLIELSHLILLPRPLDHQMKVSELR